ncbi:MAG: Signal transduction histidine kinase containing PAS domain [Candidatus Methanohalarchaeum thermophilum]|uniref:histidine kinase n=1 Tax=Methanohalarchaeum thermophilum TaxID=1903181 RepID=A0A1Q6DU12_METT1|nr:MAG: Signal transduction histidine kinase containing PAS domain [Candidatus Methanohalarchaeum thermophilum]
MFGNYFFKFTRKLSRTKRNLFTIFIFVTFDFIVFALCVFLDSGYPLFLLFFPLFLANCFYFESWSFLPPILASFSLLLVSILYYSQFFFDRIFISIFNWFIFSILFFVSGFISGKLIVYIHTLRYERKNAVIKRKKADKKKEFVNSLFTHDLRNHLQVTKGYLDLIRENPDENLLGKLEKADRSIERILNLTKNMKKINSLEQIDIEKVHANELESYLNEVLEKNREKANIEGIEIEANIEGRDVQGSALIKDVLHNLLQNSIQHADCEKITVSSKNLDDTLRITVEDDGKGIPDEEKESIFNIDFSKKLNSGGLGLYLIKEIIEMYGGKVKIKDSELGGARFDIYLKKN